MGYLQSGTYSSPWAYVSDPAPVTDYVLKHTGASSVDDLKSMDIAILLSVAKGQMPFPYGMYVDGDVLPKHPGQWLKDEAFVPFSVLGGYNHLDGYTFALEHLPHLARSGIIFKIEESDFLDIIDKNIVNHGVDRPQHSKDMIYNSYWPYETAWRPISGQIERRVAISQMITHEGFMVPLMNDLENVLDNRGWLFENSASPERGTLVLGTPYWVRATYGDMNDMTFKTKNRASGTLSGDIVELSNVFGSYISSFAQFADPTVLGTSKAPLARYSWSPYSDTHAGMRFRKHMSSSVRFEFEQRRLDMWNLVAEVDANSQPDPSDPTEAPTTTVKTTEKPTHAPSTVDPSGSAAGLGLSIVLLMLGLCL